MKVISIGSLKGGCAKTTTLFNLAGEMANRGKKVLLIDMDPQCNLSNNAGVNIAQQNSFSCQDIFTDEPPAPEQLIVKHPIAELPTLDIIPAHILLTAKEMELGSRPARERVLENYMSDYKKSFRKYDYVMIDTNPSMGLVNQNAFVVSDSIIMVTDVDDNSRLGLQLFVYLWEKTRKALRLKDNIKALILSKYDSRVKLSRELLEYLQTDNEMSGILLNSVIHERAAFKYAAINKQPVCIFKTKDNTASGEITAVADELIERGVL